MSNIAFLFPGQGAQFVGMGKDFYNFDKKAKDYFHRADKALDFELSKLCFEGPAEKLQLTENTQPAILVHSFIAASLLVDSGIYPKYLAGHSLGEISALTAFGAFTFEDGVKLVRNRGRYMQAAVPSGVGAMAAIIGLAAQQVDDLCRKVAEHTVTVANFNSDSQTVISGSKTGVEQVIELAKELKARVLPLSVSAPFHSPLMKPAAVLLKNELEAMEIQSTSVPVITNADVNIIKDPSEIRDALFKQVEHPVRWIEIIHKLVSLGIETFVEVGPGKVLCGLLRRISLNKKISYIAVSNPKSLEKAVIKLKSL